jgi:hypothetical protein
VRSRWTKALAQQVREVLPDDRGSLAVPTLLDVGAAAVAQNKEIAQPLAVET